MNRPFALLALVTALAAAGNGCPRCPTVYLVAGSADAKTSYNLLFMGSGFTKEELPTYRQAVQEYADKLLETPAFAPYAGVVNIYRVDLTSDAVDRSHCPSGCGAEALAAYTGSAPLGTPVDTGAETDATQEVDLGSHQCWTGGSDPTADCRMARLVWLDSSGREAALDLSFCAPNIAAVVVVANLDAIAGGGREDALSAGVGLTVVGAPSAGATGGAVLGEKAVALLEHELGHVLGLYDEYTNILGTPQVTFRSGRNVWRPEDSATPCAEWQFKPAAPVCPPIPWHSTMACPKGLQTCTRADQPEAGHCPWRPYEGAGNYCAASGTPVPTGLWEGAFYQPDCYYRARQNCRMQLLESDAGLCEACLLQTRRVLCRYKCPDETCCPPAYQARTKECPKS